MKKINFVIDLLKIITLKLSYTELNLLEAEKTVCYSNFKTNSGLTAYVVNKERFFGHFKNLSSKDLINVTNITVYGTLRKGFYNHYLMKNNSFLKVIVPGFEMVASEIPFAYPIEDRDKYIIAELYSYASYNLDYFKEILKKLDELEEFMPCDPHSYYRALVYVNDNKGNAYLSWIYAHQKVPGEKIIDYAKFCY